MPDEFFRRPGSPRTVKLHNLADKCKNGSRDEIGKTHVY